MSITQPRPGSEEAPLLARASANNACGPPKLLANAAAMVKLAPIWPGLNMAFLLSPSFS
jgi:hypothetical protein